MSDIEIEEHDVLDNPTIRRIFPDLSIIKKEITQYEEGLSNAVERIPQAAAVDITLVPADAADVTDLKCPESSQQVPAIINILDEDSDEQETLDSTWDTSAGPVYQKFSPLEAKVVNTLDIDTHKQLTKCSTPTNLDYLESSRQSHVSKRLEIHRRFKTFLDSLADDISDSVDNASSTSDHYINDNYPASPLNWSRNIESPDRDVKLITKNIYILGSKPSIKQPQPRKECKQIKIILKNIGPYLNESKQYCRICHTLFPSPASFKFHLSKIHFPNSSNTISGAQKSPVMQYQCDICTINLSTKPNLQRHLRMVHNFKDAKNIASDDTKSMKGKIRNVGDQVNTAVKACEAKRTSKSKNVKNKKQNKESHNCFHCEKIFESRNSLIEHLYEVINPTKTVSKNSTKSEQTSTSLNTVTDKNVDGNKPIVKTKTFGCSSCAINFNTQKQLDSHNNISHSKTKMNHINKNNRSKRSSIQQSKSISNESKKCETVKQNRSFKKENKVNTRRKNDSVRKYNSDSESDRVASDHKSSSDSLSKDEEKHESKKNINYDNVEKKLYQCFICSYYSIYFQWFSGHMARHNIKEVLREDKVVFESKCKLCSLKIPNMRHYNDHVLTCHNDIFSKKITLEDKGFHSVLFKCVICNIHFLSANAAMCHTKHAELSVNWRCLICENLFKLRDKPLHLKQHSISKNIAVYDLCASALRRILYKCLKCAVHFSEEQYFHHYSRCDLQIPYSTYCYICDILINKNDMESHEHNHKEQNIQPKDFTFIETEILESPINLNMKITTSICVDPASSFTFTFCHHCKCFIREWGNKSKAEVHKDGRCAKTLSPRLCNQCGLVLTPRGYVSHELLHRRVKNLNLQALYFFDMKSKKLIRPPVPKYPNCDICEVHFVNRLLIREHECENQSYIKCQICEMKLTEEAFKFHINYHNYQLADETQNTQLNINKVETNGAGHSFLMSGEAKLPDETQKKELNILNELINNYSGSVKSNSLPDETENIQLNINKVDTNEPINSSHMSNINDLPNETENSQLNMNKVETNAVINNSSKSVKAKLPHIDKAETNDAINNSSMQDKPKLPDETQNTQLNIDKVDTDRAVNIFSKSVRAITPEIQIVNIEEEATISSKSITPEIQIVNIDEETTVPQTKILYNCIICNVTVDTYDEVVLHCHSHYDSKEIRISEHKNMPSIDDKLGLFLKYDPFYFRFNNDVWIQHIFFNFDNEQVNKVLEKSIYKFESRFKMDEIQPGTSGLVLYKCCLCRVYIDPRDLYSHVRNICTRAKKYQCSQCGLYFNSTNVQMLHERLFHKHPDLNMTSYKIILYNKKEDEEFTKIMLNSSNKFVMYQCRACNAIVGKLQRVNHQCDNTELVKCSSCGLLFYLDEFISHRNKHQSVTNFKSENMIVVLFGKPDPQKINKLKPSFTGTIVDLTYYKCVTCGMCSKYKTHKYKHSCDTNSSKCPKCGLMFSIKDFYEHTKLHENHLELGYEDFHWNIVTYDLSTKLFRKINKASDSDIAQKKNKAEEQLNEAEKRDVIDKIYKCTCGLHFLEEMSARKHNHRVKMSKQICFKCHLLFTPGELFNHLLKHHGDKKVKYNYDIINLSEG